MTAYEAQMLILKALNFPGGFDNRLGFGRSYLIERVNRFAEK